MNIIHTREPLTLNLYLVMHIIPHWVKEEPQFFGKLYHFNVRGESFPTIKLWNSGMGWGLCAIFQPHVADGIWEFLVPLQLCLSSHKLINQGINPCTSPV